MATASRFSRGRLGALRAIPVALALAPLMVAACGARSALLDAAALEAPIEPTDAGAPSEAGLPLPDGAAVVEGTCTSALEPGAPTPMSGYCSTRAHLAPGLLPTAPIVTWQTPLPKLTPPLRPLAPPSTPAPALSARHAPPPARRRALPLNSLRRRPLPR